MKATLKIAVKYDETDQFTAHEVRTEIAHVLDHLVQHATNNGLLSGEHLTVERYNFVIQVEDEPKPEEARCSR